MSALSRRHTGAAEDAGDLDELDGLPAKLVSTLQWLNEPVASTHLEESMFASYVVFAVVVELASWMWSWCGSLRGGVLVDVVVRCDACRQDVELLTEVAAGRPAIRFADARAGAASD